MLERERSREVRVVVDSALLEVSLKICERSLLAPLCPLLMNLVLVSTIILFILFPTVVHGDVLVNFAAQNSEVGQVEILEPVAPSVVVAVNEGVFAHNNPPAMVLALDLVMSQVEWIDISMF